MTTTGNKKHIAQTGAKAGQWVKCTASECRLGGTHITGQQLFQTQEYLRKYEGVKKNMSEISGEDYKNFASASAKNFSGLKPAANFKSKNAFADQILAQIETSSRFSSTKTPISLPNKTPVSPTITRRLSQPVSVSTQTIPYLKKLADEMDIKLIIKGEVTRKFVAFGEKVAVITHMNVTGDQKQIEKFMQAFKTKAKQDDKSAWVL